MFKYAGDRAAPAILYSCYPPQMRCKGCDYPLWNLTARICPECGRPFAPSEFEFIKNSVRFCCPHCNQDYYGTGPAGHLVPSEFACVRCAQPITMDQMVLLPTAGVSEEQTLVDHMPWLERKKRGTLRAWITTVWRSMFEPIRLARSIPADSSIFQAWWFATLSHALFMATSLAPMGVLVLVTGGPAGAMAMGAFGGMALGMVIFWALFIPLWGAAAHAVLWATGDIALPVGASVRTVCYASGANAPLMVPCFGTYFGWLWGPISAALMLKTTQQVHAFRAFLAAFALPVLVVGALVLWFFVAVYSVGSSVNVARAAATAAISESAATQQVLTALITHADAHAGAGPAHAVELVHGNNLSAYTLALNNDISTVHIGNTTMDRFMLMPKAQEDALVAAAVARLPADVIAHRLGDFVFTYHGINFTRADPGLWVVVASPDPDNFSPNTIVLPAAVTIGTAGRQINTVPRSAFPAALAAQNKLRASLGLPPLPNPATITSAAPALPGAPGLPPDPP